MNPDSGAIELRLFTGQFCEGTYCNNYIWRDLAALKGGLSKCYG